MFKTAILYRASAVTTEKLSDYQFAPCGATQEKSLGWVPPRGEAHGPLVEVVAGQRILKLMIETKSVPSDVVQREANIRAARIQEAEGRKPGKKEMREIKEEVKLSLLPVAFSKRSSHLVWFLPNGYLVIDASSHAKADDVITMLVQSFDGLSITHVNTETSAQTAMAHWLIEQEPPAGFSIDRECELKATDESKAVVKYGRHPLDIDEVQAHIKQGKLPTKLAMTYEGRASFVLTEAMTLKKIQLLDIVFEGNGEEDGFDADIAIMSGELTKLIDGLIDALGGELKIED